MFILIFSALLIYIFTYVPSLSKQHGNVEAQLYLGDGEQ
jgi:hypothetical protein